ncbi:VapE domain-containing protein [Spirosoma rhododendri]|uniref:Virulence protein n=1 Tax=Spirosoma rhododendri TaxID=2728024 RepID=A0A7L5DSN9_9BACT|nr:VapE domain-containing protein [Spirosoma rhododendri]QJD79588.1 virulence protein [Spirosoma rhododendri]
MKINNLTQENILPVSKKRSSDKADTPQPAPAFQSKRKVIEEYLSFRFQFRYNVLNGRIEWGGKAKGNFEALEDYALNSIIRQIDNETGVATSPDKMKVILKSDFTPQYNPLHAYFQSLPTPQSSGAPTIKALAATVQTESNELFCLSLTRWLVASIANAFNPEGCQNQTCLVLTGTQGAFKTTWLNMLCPPDLLRYLFCGKINLESKDTLILLGEKFIVNLDDQLRSLNKRDGETVKTLITQGNITVRRPYDALSSELPRIASFLGSVNGNDFLTDPTGSRRFLPFEAFSIDIQTAQAIDINQVWAEAYQLFREGFTYWFTADETASLFANNENFQVDSPEYELLLEYYEPVENREWATAFLTSTAILANLEMYTRQKLRAKQLGEALRKLQFMRFNKKLGGSSPVHVWAVRERSDLERETKRTNL